MSFAYNLLREQPHYRREAFSSGLKAVGFDVRTAPPAKFEHSDLLLIWSRYGAMHELAVRAEAAGATVAVSENGYLNPGGTSPHSDSDRQIYALAIGQHNDSTAVPDGDGSRWSSLAIDLKPWRTDGAHILLLPNRSFGTPGRVMPVDWIDQTAKRLRKLTKREIRTRLHPGNSPPRTPLADDLAGAHCVIQWHSSAGVHALIQGIPVISLAPAWIAMDAAGRSLDQIESPPMPDRLPAMQRLARAQFSVTEIADGSAFRHVLGRVLSDGQGKESARL